MSVHGANRLGGNSLLEAVVFGIRSGNRLAEFLDGYTSPDRKADNTLLDHAVSALAAMFADETTEETPVLRREMERADGCEFRPVQAARFNGGGTGRDRGARGAVCKCSR